METGLIRAIQHLPLTVRQQYFGDAQVERARDPRVLTVTDCFD